MLAVPGGCSAGRDICSMKGSVQHHARARRASWCCRTWCWTHARRGSFAAPHQQPRSRTAPVGAIVPHSAGGTAPLRQPTRRDGSDQGVRPWLGDRPAPCPGPRRGTPLPTCDRRRSWADVARPASAPACTIRRRRPWCGPLVHRPPAHQAAVPPAAEGFNEAGARRRNRRTGATSGDLDGIQASSVAPVSDYSRRVLTI